jgi:cysteine-rich repeat protein
VTVLEAGSVTIEERPISTSPPPNCRYVTQEIAVTAPPSSAMKPLEFVFDLESTRLPNGKSKDYLKPFRNGFLVPACTRADEHAKPDPCVRGYSTLDDGDLRFVILTSAASTWNIGLVSGSTAVCGNDVVEPDEACDDGDHVDGDCCSASCTFAPNGAACDDGNRCTTSSMCDGLGLCQAGESADSACDDGDACTSDRCDSSANMPSCAHRALQREAGRCR